MQKDEMKTRETRIQTLRTFRRNVSGLGPLFFGPNSSLSRSLKNKNNSRINQNLIVWKPAFYLGFHWEFNCSF